MSDSDPAIWWALHYALSGPKNNYYAHSIRSFMHTFTANADNAAEGLDQMPPDLQKVLQDSLGESDLLQLGEISRFQRHWRRDPALKLISRVSFVDVSSSDSPLVHKLFVPKKLPSNPSFRDQFDEDPAQLYLPLHDIQDAVLHMRIKELAEKASKGHHLGFDRKSLTVDLVDLHSNKTGLAAIFHHYSGHCTSLSVGAPPKIHLSGHGIIDTSQRSLCHSYRDTVKLYSHKAHVDPTFEDLGLSQEREMRSLAELPDLLDSFQSLKVVTVRPIASLLNTLPNAPLVICFLWDLHRVCWSKLLLANQTIIESLVFTQFHWMDFFNCPHRLGRRSYSPYWTCLCDMKRLKRLELHLEPFASHGSNPHHGTTPRYDQDTSFCLLLQLMVFYENVDFIVKSPYHHQLIQQAFQDFLKAHAAKRAYEEQDRVGTSGSDLRCREPTPPPPPPPPPQFLPPLPQNPPHAHAAPHHGHDEPPPPLLHLGGPPNQFAQDNIDDALSTDISALCREKSRANFATPAFRPFAAAVKAHSVLTYVPQLNWRHQSPGGPIHYTHTILESAVVEALLKRITFENFRKEDVGWSQTLGGVGPEGSRQRFHLMERNEE